jgi:TolA-binding protein
MLELEQPAKAADELRAALALPGIGKWKDVAEFGLLQILFDTGKFQEFVERFEDGAKDLGPDLKPQLLILAAKAQARLGKSEESLKLFDQVVKEFPESGSAKEATYERLVALYQSGADNVLPEIDKYVAANPDAPRRDQVQLMKAEVLFKKQDYAAAAPIYEQVNGSRTLPGALRGEALFKLGWCYMETRQYEAAVKTYTTFTTGYPTSKSLAAALCQRGLANLRLKATTAALKDFDELISRFPKAKERELALQQKALLLGQQNDNDRMAQTFQLLLKDYPNTPPPAAAEANYWIGWVAFENKDYKAATAPLAKAREIDREQYFERASLRILLAHYYQEEKDAVAREVEIYTKGEGKAKVPDEVLRWLGETYARAGETAEDPEAAKDQFTKAARFLGQLTVRDDAEPEDSLRLGQVHLKLEQFDKAITAFEAYVTPTKDPADRAEGLIFIGHAHIGLKDLDAARKSADEALALQPDGALNARARILAGDVDMARTEFEKAAKVYESVSVVIDDEKITPEALEKAVAAYRQAGNESEAKRLLNLLQSRYPEYYQRKKSPDLAGPPP